LPVTVETLAQRGLHSQYFPPECDRITPKGGRMGHSGYPV
jgi:hypothetical protein